MNAIEKPFGKKRVFLPVIHPTSRDAALRALEVAYMNGADGAFLINQGMESDEVLALAAEVTRQIRAFWLGANLLDRRAPDVLAEWGKQPAYSNDVPLGLWSDAAEPVSDRGVWPGLYFGGVAFKYQRKVKPEDESAEIERALAGGVDVVTTSGSATGKAAPLDKIKRMKEILGNRPLAVASGITPENVKQYLPYVDAYLVATGIEKEFGVLDPERVQRLADLIHA